ncbi:alpha/beta fold hydrolase [Pseudonocardia sp. KRD291]|uniref:alpha/beta fold hydrolase n=1 Tax=Pseudonocardia sp. KRD291 TaxID=2792007 RepID=UPI001C4A626A|nr:alpha/beta fold hydrolase [Pseudonocardia sp. KRD291]MBW0101115.1 alpha/beta fold hydrolase [Pseudonocardia sp. KRD291]
MTTGTSRGPLTAGAPAPPTHPSPPGDLATVTVRGARIRVRTSGDPAAPPVLLLHGIGRSLEDWDAQHERLSGTHRVISTDLAGFGLSDRLPGPATFEQLADGAVGVLDAIGERRPVHLMGNSLGGAVAMLVLTRAPERVATLTLVDAAGFGSEVTVALRVLGIPFVGARLLTRIDRAAARRTERAIFLDDAFVTEERVSFALEVAARADQAAVFADIARELGTVRGVRPQWRAALLAEVARRPRPTLAVWGERDIILPGHHLRAALAAIPHARSHVFARCGHMPQIERADAFADLALTFLRDAAREPNV